MRTLRRASLGTCLAAVLALAFACGGTSDGQIPAPSSDAPPGRVPVVATTSVAADLVRRIGGDLVVVDTLLPPNVAAHDFEPASGDVNTLGRAQLVVRIGSGLEPWLDSTLAASSSEATLVDLSKDIQLRGGAGEGEQQDPHIWHDATNMQTMAETLTTALIAADVGRTATYQTNLDTYLVQLETLDREITAQIAALPNKKLVTDHDAFGYYVDRYGLDFVGSILPTFETSAELSAADLEDLVGRIRAEGVPAVFTEATLSPVVAGAIARQAGVKVVGGEGALYGDALGPPGSPAGDYLGMMRHNTKVFVENLR